MTRTDFQNEILGIIYLRICGRRKTEKLCFLSPPPESRLESLSRPFLSQPGAYVVPMSLFSLSIARHVTMAARVLKLLPNF
jgi:hypothetical protein